MKYDQTIITPKGLAVHIRNGVASDGSAVLDQHWFHTKEQMQFLDHWIKNRRPCNETGIQAPDGSSLYQGNGKGVTEFTVNIPESGTYPIFVEAHRAKGIIQVQRKEERN